MLCGISRFFCTVGMLKPSVIDSFERHIWLVQLKCCYGNIFLYCCSNHSPCIRKYLAPLLRPTDLTLGLMATLSGSASVAFCYIHACVFFCSYNFLGHTFFRDSKQFRRLTFTPARIHQTPSHALLRLIHKPYYGREFFHRTSLLQPQWIQTELFVSVAPFQRGIWIRLSHT